MAVELELFETIITSYGNNNILSKQLTLISKALITILVYLHYYVTSN